MPAYREPKIPRKIDNDQFGTEKLAGIPVTKSVNENMEEIKKIFGDSADLKSILFHFPNLSFGLIHLEGMSDRAQLEEVVIKPLIKLQKNQPDLPFHESPELIVQSIAVSSELTFATHANELADSLLAGKALLFVEHLSFAYILPIESWKTRSIEEPVAQTMVRGPREGFVESLNTNISLLRRRISTPNLHIKKKTVGKITQTNLLVCYLDGMVDKSVLQTLLFRISSIETDKLFDTGMLEELLEDQPYTPFPVFQATERPDVAAAAISEGKITIFMEGTPFAIIAPATFWSFFQAAEDYYQHYDLSTFVRFIRIISYFIALSLPAFYIALTTFQPELIPSALLVSLASQREGIPFPAFVEALLMEMIFEILREAGIRMPRAIGSAVSIVGAIVIGESAVAAGLVSPAIVIVVSLTAIASFVSPYYSFSGSARLLRFLLMIMASTLGIYGIIMFSLALVVHLCSVTTIGKPYFEPFAPFSLDEQKDVFFRMPLWWTKSSFYKKLKSKMERRRSS